MVDMPNNLTRKKVCMGTGYEIPVPLKAYGGAIVRVHPLSDSTLTKIEMRLNYGLEKVLEAFASAGLTPGEIKSLETKNASPETMAKLISKTMDPKIKEFLVELCREGIVPEADPDCPTCHGKPGAGKICPDCDLRNAVDDLKGFSTTEIGMAIIGASLSEWKEIEDFFSRPRVPSGPA